MIHVFFFFLVMKTSGILFFFVQSFANLHGKRRQGFVLVMKTSGILIFGPSFRKPARKASSEFCCFGYEKFWNFIFWPKLSQTCTESVVRVCFFGYKNFRNFIFWPKLSQTCTESFVRAKQNPDDAFRAGLRKLGPKNEIPEVFITKKIYIYVYIMH